VLHDVRPTSKLGGFRAGQRLPAHELDLLEPADIWPKAWQSVLAKLSTVDVADKSKTTAPAGSTLRAVQTNFSGQRIVQEKVDDSLVWWRSLSAVTAAQALAAILAKLGPDAAQTTVLCEDADLAGLLDDALAAHDVPVMGVTAASNAYPALQVLPLALGLLWKPTDPERILDLLLLPVGPIPIKWAHKLADALGEQPGIGGEIWTKTIEELSAQDPEKAKEYKERLILWLSSYKAQQGEAVSRSDVAERCKEVAKWAGRRAAAMESDISQQSTVVTLKIAASQAGALADLAADFPQPISEPQLQRLIASVCEGGVIINQRLAQSGGPRWIRSLAEIDAPCQRLIWLGTHSTDGPVFSWTNQEAKSLEKAGIGIGFEAARHAHKRRLERLGMMKFTGSILVVELSNIGETPEHPLWTAVRAALGKRQPLSLEDVIAEGGTTGKWPLSVEERRLAPARKKNAIWSVDAKLLHDRDSTSAGDLETQLACPLKWVLSYVAKLRSSPVAGLPSDYQMFGNLSHAIIEEVFTDSKDSSVDAVAAKALKVFDRRVATEAMVLDSPHMSSERLALRTQIEKSVRALCGVLERGKYKMSGFEVTPHAKLLGKEFNGRIDCLLTGKDDSLAIIDIKYAGIRKFPALLEDGAATQLATYAAALAQERTNGEVKEIAAGYFIIDRARLLTPGTGALAGSDVSEQIEEAPSFEQVWNNFTAALKQAEGWLESGDIPVRPLQKEDAWPAGAKISLREKKNGYKSDFSGFTICEYCSYSQLCGKDPVL
ncbi:MAG: PD-(D/E)XK nuclease family protein, partial [Elusimicrobiota bacterium]